MHKTRLVRSLLGRKIERVMHHATLVIVGNEYLADRAKQAGASRVEYLPSVVDVNRYELKQPKNVSTFRVGWIGSPLTAKYLSLVGDVVKELAHESNIQMVLLGIGPNMSFQGVPTEVLSWNEEIELVLSQKMDVGIMPLIDEPFERGKCGYKLIQYMAGGIPVVASPIGVNRHIVEHQVNGYLAASKEDWLFALRSLRDSLEKRAVMGWAAHQKAEKLYNLQVTAPILHHLLMSVVRNKKT
jgi:glycosyltransferase involved in cell wall biosynthesis